MGKQRMSITLTRANKDYLKRIAWEFGSDLTTEINRIVAEKRMKDSTQTASHCQEERVN